MIYESDGDYSDDDDDEVSFLDDSRPRRKKGSAGKEKGLSLEDVFTDKKDKDRFYKKVLRRSRKMIECLLFPIVAGKIIFSMM